MVHISVKRCFRLKLNNIPNEINVILLRIDSNGNAMVRGCNTKDIIYFNLNELYDSTEYFIEIKCDNCN